MSHEVVAEEPADGQATSIIRWLIAASVALYFLQLTLFSAADMRAALGFEPRDLDGAVWTVGTFLFVHGGFWHLLLNVYGVWLFGPRLASAWGRAQFATYYALCGLGAWLFHMLFVRHGVLIGSSAAVLGVMFAYATRWPGERVRVLGVAWLPVGWVVAALGVANLAVGMTADPGLGAAYLVHAGGLVVGWMYMRIAGSMQIDRFRQRVAAVPDEPDEMPPRAFPRSLPRQRGGREAREVDDIVAQSHAAVAEATARTPHPDATPTPHPGYSPVELNSLLDKISAQGLDALTAAERKQLEDAARRLKDQ
jgi:membrane associated rhomboid family serine protease